MSQIFSFGRDPGIPTGTPQYESNRIVLMAIANNPNVSPATLTNMVERINTDAQSSSGIRSRIDAGIDNRLGIPTTSLDPNAINTDIVARAIVGNPKTDPTIKVLANDKSPMPVNPVVAKQAFMAINKANDLFLNGKYSEAADQYKSAIATTFHDSENAYYELAQCYIRMQQPDNARQALMQALNININYTPAALLVDKLNQGGRTR
jgi:TolA-binding protein